MNFAHIHLVLTHFPPVLSLGSAVSAAVGLLRRRRDLVQLALVLLVAVGAMMPVVFFAGNRAADSIGRVDGVQQDAIAPHQRAAAIAMAVSIGAAVVAVGLLLLERRRGTLTLGFQVLVLIAALTSALPIGWAAALGGAIHHPEIQMR
jgi:putative Mn2+ efflux pump MntP